MKPKRSDSSLRSPVWRCATVIGFLLIGMALVLQAVHFHPNEFSSDAKPCVFCQVSHAPLQVTPAVAPTPQFSLKEFIASAVNPDPGPLVSPFSLFSRPPPSA